MTCCCFSSKRFWLKRTPEIRSMEVMMHVDFIVHYAGANTRDKPITMSATIMASQVVHQTR